MTIYFADLGVGLRLMMLLSFITSLLVFLGLLLWFFAAFASSQTKQGVVEWPACDGQGRDGKR